VVSSIPGVNRISRFRAENTPEGIFMEIDLVLVYGYVIRPLLEEVQVKVRDEVERLTALNIKSINVYARSIVVETPQASEQTQQE
jgi:uncharacterized alkaline shock family protein YloU